MQNYQRTVYTKNDIIPNNLTQQIYDTDKQLSINHINWFLADREYVSIIKSGSDVVAYYILSMVLQDSEHKSYIQFVGVSRKHQRDRFDTLLLNAMANFLTGFEVYKGDFRKFCATLGLENCNQIYTIKYKRS